MRINHVLSLLNSNAPKLPKTNFYNYIIRKTLQVTIKFFYLVSLSKNCKLLGVKLTDSNLMIQIQLLLSLDVRCTSEVKLHNSQKNINEG